MPSGTPVSPQLNQLLPRPDPTALLTKAFMGKSYTTGKPTRVCSGTVQTGNPGAEQCVVALDNFDPYGMATWVARFERRVTVSGSTASWAPPPPPGTRCIVVFPENESDYSPWVVTFVGYP